MKKKYLGSVIATLLVATVSGCGAISDSESVKVTNYQSQLMANLDATKAPAQNFVMDKWKINLPTPDTNPAREGKTMEILAAQLTDPQHPFSHPDWFYTNPKTGAMVFKVPNEAVSTPNSKNARSELRAMLNVNMPKGYNDPSTNFVVAAHENADTYGSIGGRLSAVLSVDHVSTSGNDQKSGAYAVVIGQIHGSKNEPLKIFYRKLPNHEHGSLFWNYEINPENKKDRFDVKNNVFGNYSLTKADSDPVDGLMLGELFSYDVVVKDNMMNLTFKKHIGEANETVKTYQVNLSQPHPASQLDRGYGQDWMYFKAGAYNQCNIKATSSACTNNGLEAGDYAQASFYKLELDQ